MSADATQSKRGSRVGDYEAAERLLGPGPDYTPWWWRYLTWWRSR